MRCVLSDDFGLAVRWSPPLCKLVPQRFSRIAVTYQVDPERQDGLREAGLVIAINYCMILQDHETILRVFEGGKKPAIATGCACTGSTSLCSGKGGSKWGGHVLSGVEARAFEQLQLAAIVKWQASDGKKGMDLFAEASWHLLAKD